MCDTKFFSSGEDTHSIVNADKDTSLTSLNELLDSFSKHNATLKRT